MKIALAADHGAFELKESIKKHLDEKKIEYHDFGCYSKESVDYPRYAFYAASAVAKKEYDFGIICCTTGLGVSMAANKVKGIRAAVCTNTYMAEMTKRHNNANIIALGGRVINEDEAKEIVKAWWNATYEGGRHQNRLDKITQIENEQ